MNRYPFESSIDFISTVAADQMVRPSTRMEWFRVFTMPNILCDLEGKSAIQAEPRRLTARKEIKVKDLAARHATEADVKTTRKWISIENKLQACVLGSQTALPSLQFQFFILG